MESIFVVMQSTIRHDAYDNFDDFLLGVQLGSLGFTNLYTFEYPDESDFWDDESLDITYFSTAPLSETEQKEISSILYKMREGRELHDKKNIQLNKRKVYLFAWYEDAIHAYEKHQS